MELTQMVSKHNMRYDGSWDQMYCKRCHKTFYIRTDMCDSEGISKELKRINKIPCKTKGK